jgi:hypothetical protein
MKKRILVKVEDYKIFIEKNGSNKLDDRNEIYTFGSFPPKFYRDKNKINEEIFEGISCSYKILKKSDDEILIKFESKSSSEYRIDILKDPNTNIWHIGFSEIDNKIDDIEKYQSLTEKDEAIDVISRLVFILKNINMSVEYCIGATGNDKKDRIYEYIMRFVSNWEKRNTNEYPLGWAIYFKI